MIYNCPLCVQRKKNSTYIIWNLWKSTLYEFVPDYLIYDKSLWHIDAAWPQVKLHLVFGLWVEFPSFTILKLSSKSSQDYCNLGQLETLLRVYWVVSWQKFQILGDKQQKKTPCIQKFNTNGVMLLASVSMLWIIKKPPRSNALLNI